MLCPATEDWDNLMCVSNILPPVPSRRYHRCQTNIFLLYRTRERIRSFDIPVTANDFPKFLWENEKVTPQAFNKGFLRGELLLKVRTSFSYLSPPSRDNY